MGEIESYKEWKSKTDLGVFDYEILLGALHRKKIKTLDKDRLRILIQNRQGLGIRKQNLLNCAKGEWILMLDTDELVLTPLAEEVQQVIMFPQNGVNGYEISYQNYVFGKPVYFGGEKYSKVRLFRRKYGSMTQESVHEEVIVAGKIGKLKNYIHHYSYRSLGQVLSKFTRYACQVAAKKRYQNENISLKKLFMYGPHMFWSRAINDQGWRDGWRGIVLALCFGYMEAITYWLLLWKYIAKK